MGYSSDNPASPGWWGSADDGYVTVCFHGLFSVIPGWKQTSSTPARCCVYMLPSFDASSFSWWGPRDRQGQTGIQGWRGIKGQSRIPYRSCVKSSNPYSCRVTSVTWISDFPPLTSMGVFSPNKDCIVWFPLLLFSQFNQYDIHPPVLEGCGGRNALILSLLLNTITWRT